MHEFSLCEELVKIIISEMQKLDPPAIRLHKARLAVGALRQVVPDAMTFAFEVITKDTPVEGAELEMRFIPIRVRCQMCDWQGEVEGMIFQCGSCGAVKLDVLSGRELYLESLEIEQNEHAGN